MKTIRSIKQDRWTKNGPAVVLITCSILLAAAWFQTSPSVILALSSIACLLLMGTIVGLAAHLRLFSRIALTRFGDKCKEQDQAQRIAKKLASHKLCIDAHAIVSITDAKGRITYANDKFCEVSQYSQDELLGQDHRILNSGYHDAAFFKELYATVMQGGIWSGKVRNKAKDGSYYWIETTIAPIQNEFGELEEFISIRTDITDIKHKEEELVNTNQILQSVFDNFPGAISVYDDALRLKLANAAFYDLLSMPEEAYPAGCSLEDLLRFNSKVGQYGKGEVDAQIAERMALARARKPYTFTRTTVEGRVLEVRGWPMANGGLLSTHIDVTERHDMIKDLQIKNEEAKQTAIQLEVARREQMRSHEHLLNSINSMQNGFAIWDSEGVLLLANSAFREFHAPIAHIIQAGLQLEAFLRAGIEAELWVTKDNHAWAMTSPDDWIATRLKEHHRVDDVEVRINLRNGKSIVMNKRRMSNGNVISSLVDVTAQREREEELRRTRDALEHIAYFDALTTLPNRAHCQQDLEALFRNPEGSESFALIQLDLDKFKRVNDTMGHAAGDHLLKVAGSRLAFLATKVSAFKPYRWGGDEFVAIVRLDNEIDLEDLCQELTDLVAVPVPYEKTTLWPTASIGVATYPADAKNLEELMMYADLALYKTKQMGRDGYQFFAAEMKEKIDSDIRIEHGVRKALEFDQFELYFQPQVSAIDETIEGIEALVRWNHPERGQLPPGLFMQVVESNGLASALGRTVFDKAMAAARCWMDEGLSFGRLAINLSPGHIQKATLVDDFCESLEKHAVNPDLLAVELLESVWLDDNDGYINEIFQRLSAAGVHVELDDFGTGHASLSHLSTLPIDGIKIDRSLISNLVKGDKHDAILEMVTSMTRLMKLRVVCEGVETSQQMEAVSKIANCSIQGYLVSRPLNFEQMSNWIREERNIGSLKPREPRHAPVSQVKNVFQTGLGIDPII